MLRGISCLVLALVVSAGCATNDPASPLDATAAPPQPVTHGVPVALPQDSFAAEPRIARLADGTLFVAAPTGYQSSLNLQRGAQYLWRSTNGGTTWETLRSPGTDDGTNLMCSCDADVVTSNDGWVYASDWYYTATGSGGFNVEASPDGGASWTTAIVTQPMTNNIDRQWLAAGPDGLVALTYAFTPPYRVGLDGSTPAGGFDREIWSVVSRDHGATWGVPQQVVAYQPGVMNHGARPLFLEDGTILMLDGHAERGVVAPDAPTGLRMYRSTDEGQTWSFTTAAVAPQGLHYYWALQAATDGKQRVAIVWTAAGNGTEPLWMVQSTDAGATWGTPRVVSTGGINLYPWIDMDAEGRMALAWYHQDDAGDWYPYVALLGSDGQGAVGPADEAAAAQGAICQPDCSGDNPLRDFLSVVLTGPRSATVAYMRDGPGEFDARAFTADVAMS